MAQSLQKKYDEFGFQYLELVWFDYSGMSYAEADAGDAQAFMDEYGFTTAMAVADTQGFHALWEVDGASPSISFIGPDMTVLAVDTTTTSPAAYLEMD